MLARLVLAPWFLAASSFSISAQDIVTADWRCPSYGVCWDGNGNRVRLSENQNSTMPRHQGLRVLECSDRALSVEILPDELACMQKMFGLPEGPASDIDFEVMETAARERNLEGALRAIARIGYTVGGGDPQEAAAALIDPAAIVSGQPDAALFIHPRSQDSWMGAAFEDIGRYLNGDGGGMGVQTRWPDLGSFAGRELSVSEGGIEPLLLRLGPTGARVEVAGGVVHEADYSSEGGFDCIPSIPSLRGHCLGLVVQKTGGSAAKPWLLRAALRGDERPIVFGTVTEGQEAFERATASHADAEATTATEQAAAQARLAAGEELETLPLHDIEAGAAFYAAQVYASPTRPDAEFVSQARIPFLAYHAAYAATCANDFDGVARIWRDVGTRLVDSGDVPGNRFRIYEEYIREEVPVQGEAFARFALEIEVWRNGWLIDAGRAIRYYPYAADFLAMLDARFVDWAAAWKDVISILGCRGPTIDRLEANLLASHALIDGP